jgi:glycosyltransferase involved in cell wall biosynthesis
MNDLITICIPTCRRPDLLQESVESCFRQSYRPLEILIGDDSGDDRSIDKIQALSRPPGITITHAKHEPPLGQARNVNWLFLNSRGNRLLLLHDDDLLCDGGLDKLVAVWIRHSEITCAYGKQYLISSKGEVQHEETEAFNRRYDRVQANQGVQASAITAALSQQLPNNCFLLDAKSARAVGYRSEEEIGNSVDVDFGIRLAQSTSGKSFVFIDEFVSFYRLTEHSILRSRSFNYGEHLLFYEIMRLNVSEYDLAARNQLLRRISARAVLNAAMARDRLKALKIFLSRHYALRYADIRSLYRLAYIASPVLGNRLNRFLSSSR